MDSNWGIACYPSRYCSAVDAGWRDDGVDAVLNRLHNNDFHMIECSLIESAEPALAGRRANQG